MATLLKLLLVLVLFTATASHVSSQQMQAELPVVVSTWAFVDAVRAAARHLIKGGSAVDAIVHGCSACELLQCDGSVGFGGSPDEGGETTLDAMIMDGTTMNVGAVGALRSVKGAIDAARLVMDHSEHTLLVGSQASTFALSLGLPGPTNLSTDDSLQAWSSWKTGGCQPNFWRDVVPDSTSACGPYQASSLFSGRDDHSMIGDGVSKKLVKSSSDKSIGYGNHDTISMVVIDSEGRIAAGTSTNGASHKIPGRVGDGAIVGASAYADDDVGACGATGDGDVMMRFLPCYQAVESMRQGMTPDEAARDAIARIRRKFPTFIGAVVAINKYGIHAGACHGWVFQYTVQDAKMADAVVFSVKPDIS